MFLEQATTSWSSLGGLPSLCFSQMRYFYDVVDILFAGPREDGRNASADECGTLAEV